ncbi:hypothetical protein [uncultured Abyssibacter sp.]|uniref:hypothetical protein n=1 Tax=uncultured Abyssibacter sp. TaxID=2320202 RepID=UPI0032B20FA6
MHQDEIRELFNRQAASYDTQWAKTASIIESGGFESPVRFFQAGLIHAWLSTRARRG